MDQQNWVNKVLTVIAESSSYSQFLTDNNQVPSSIPEELTVVDTSLHIALSKVIPENILSILDSEMDEKPTSGMAILLELEDSLEVPRKPTSTLDDTPTANDNPKWI